MASTALWALLSALLLHAATAFCPHQVFANQTACSCFDYVDGAVIKCSGKDGPLIVERLKALHVEIRELALESANIVEIGPRAFKNLRIKKLVLDKNSIKHLHTDAFQGLESSLQELHIAQNKLSQVPTDSLVALRSLAVLNLKCNMIGDLKQPVFKNLSSLIDLNLACNQICNIEQKAFDGVRKSLQNLILDSNCLKRFPSAAVANMNNLIALHLKYNQIGGLAENQVQNLTTLSMLTFTGNNISAIHKKAFRNVPNLRYLYLGENAIKSFDVGTMSQFKNLQVFDLSFNELSEITTETFAGLESLQHINLESNNIKDIAPGAFAGTPLLLMWLPNNCLTSVTAQMFTGAPFLRQVSFANNNIRSVQPQSFAHLANLHTLDLSGNKIQHLAEQALQGSDHLTVRLQENPMVCSQEGYHVMNGGQAINLTSEPNLICQTDFMSDVMDQCPRAAPRPLPPTCCSHRRVELPLTTTHRPTTTTEAVIEEEPQTTAAPIHRTVNQERWLRLSKRPLDTSEKLTRFRTPLEVQKPSAYRHLPRYMKTTTGPEEEEEDDEVEEVLEDDDEEYEATTPMEEEEEVQTRAPPRRVPARVRERQRQKTSEIPPWLRPAPRKEKQPENEFNEDEQADTEETVDATPVRL